MSAEGTVSNGDTDLWRTKGRLQYAELKLNNNWLALNRTLYEANC